MADAATSSSQASGSTRPSASAADLVHWARRNRYYYTELARLFRLHVPAGTKVLHVGCGIGDMLAALQPIDGWGIDLNGAAIEEARRRHRDQRIRFETLDPETFRIDETFDYVIIDSALADLRDIQASLECIRGVCSPHTRIVLSYYNALWGPLLRAASRLKLRRPTGEQNWLSNYDFDNLLQLSGFEVVTRSTHTLLPKRVPGLNAFFNRVLPKFWPFSHLALTQLYVARVVMPPKGTSALSCTIVIPTRNERGNIQDAVRRIPRIGSHTEIIFVDGNSTDGTQQEIEQAIAHHPEKDIKFIPQGGGHGKGDAVRKGFAAATGDVLMILDADLTVPPEDLPRFFKPIQEGTAEFINGTRLVYPMEEQAMRFLNKVGNRFFSALFTWLLGQRFRDTLCGTKALSREHYHLIAANRSYFGDFDPFGDFDLIFGAAKANLKIIEVPVRYRARTYGETNIHRFRHGWLLLKMSWIAFKRLKMR